MLTLRSDFFRISARLLTACLLLCSLVPGAKAETEGFAYLCEAGTCFWRRPVLDPPPGWIRDDESSRYFRFNAFTPRGSTFTDSEAVLYAHASFRRGKAPSLAEHITADRVRFLGSNPGLKISEVQPTQNGDAKRLPTFAFTPVKAGAGDWDTVAYDEEGDYYFVFVLSARNKGAHDKALEAFARWVGGYRKAAEKPDEAPARPAPPSPAH